MNMCFSIQSQFCGWYRQIYTAMIYVSLDNLYQNYLKSNMELQLEFESSYTKDDYTMFYNTRLHQPYLR